MDQSIVYHHLIFIKEEGRRLAPRVLELMKGEGFPHFMVREYGRQGKEPAAEHYHMLLRCPWKEGKIRREVDKIREKKAGDFSYRGAWLGTRYLCKGESPADPPDVVSNTLPDFTDEHIAQLHREWWKDIAFTEADPDYDMPKPLDLLVDWVKDRSAQGVDTTEFEAMEYYVDLIVQISGKKALANRMNAQCYVRTALLFAKSATRYKARIINHFCDGIFG